jgi:hypothetical protein
MKQFVLALLLSTSLLGQKGNVDEVIKFNPRNLGVIRDNGRVKGYYFFYTQNKSDLKHNHYGLQILDAQMNPVKKSDFTKDKNLLLKSAAYSGSHFCFSFVNTTKGHEEFTIFDGDLKPVNSFSFEIFKEQTSYTHTLIAAPNVGFVAYGPNKKGKTELYGVSNQGEKLWSAKGTRSAEKGFETISSIGSGEGFVAFCETYRRRYFQAQDGDCYIRLIDPRKGSDLFNLKINEANEHIVIESISVEGDSYLFSGYFMDLKKSSQGVALIRVAADGKLITKKLLDLDREAPVLAEDAFTKNALAGKSIYFDSAEQLANGNMVLVTQLYNKSNMYDLVFFEMDHEFNLKDINVIKKDPAPINKVMNSMWAGKIEMNGIIKFMGFSDIYFTSVSDDRLTSTTVFRNLNKTNHEFTIRSAKIRDKKFETQELRVTTHADEIWTLPAVEGGVAIFQYSSKEKRLEMRVQKL